MTSAISNRGRLVVMIFRQSFTASVFLNFLRRLVRSRRKTKRKVYLIADGQPVHKSRAVTGWLEKRADHLRIFWLPADSPERNPDEWLNQEVKTNALGRVRPANLHQRMDFVGCYLRIRQGSPKRVKRYFHERHVQYAA